MGENENIVPVATAVIVRKPTEILAEAKIAAEALAQVIKSKKNPVIFNNEQYLEFEDWQTCGKFYGLTAKVSWTRPIEIGGALGFEAGAEVVDNRTGMIVSSAEAMCLNDEDKWSKRTKYKYNETSHKREKVGEVPVPLFQLRSMSQTRACAKALRNVLAWVVVLAGFQPNVAEELTGDEFKPENPKANVQQPKRKSEALPAENGDAHDQRTYKDRLYEALGGDVQQLEALTAFWSERDQKQIAGCRKWEWLTEPRAKVAYHIWEREQEAGQREPGQD